LTCDTQNRIFANRLSGQYWNAHHSSPLSHWREAYRAAAAGPGAACASPRLKRFTQRHQFKRIFL
jgi:hypothetical protein